MQLGLVCKIYEQEFILIIMFPMRANTVENDSISFSNIICHAIMNLSSCFTQLPPTSTRKMMFQCLCFLCYVLCFIVLLYIFIILFKLRSCKQQLIESCLDINKVNTFLNILQASLIFISKV